MSYLKNKIGLTENNFKETLKHFLLLEGFTAFSEHSNSEFEYTVETSTHKVFLNVNLETEEFNYRVEFLNSEVESESIYYHSIELSSFKEEYKHFINAALKQLYA